MLRIGVSAGVRVRSARMPASRSWSTVPNGAPMLAILNEPKVLSLTMASELPSLAPLFTGPA